VIKRREFLIGSAAAVGSPVLWGQAADQAKLARVGVMSYGFNLIIKSDAHPDDPRRTLDILDFPEEMANRYGIHHVEIQHSHFRSTEPAYFEEFRNRLKKARSQMSQLVLEFGALNVSSADPVVRLETIELTKRWIDHAVSFGCPRVMVNQGTLAAEVRPTAIETLKTINAYAQTKKVWVTVENRDDAPRAGGGRAGAVAAAGTANIAAPPPPARPHTWEVEAEVIKAAGVWANPDVSSFPDNQAREAGLRTLYAMTAGSSHFKNMPDLFDSARVVQISKEVGYKGLYSIEAEPLSADPYPFVQTIVGVLLKAL
jgi:sugar phosphate isomerase/epimerase